MPAASRIVLPSRKFTPANTDGFLLHSLLHLGGLCRLSPKIRLIPRNAGLPMQLALGLQLCAGWAAKVTWAPEAPGCDRHARGACQSLKQRRASRTRRIYYWRRCLHHSVRVKYHSRAQLSHGSSPGLIVVGACELRYVAGFWPCCDSAGRD